MLDRSPATSPAARAVYARITAEGLPPAFVGLALIYAAHAIYHRFGGSGVIEAAWVTSITSALFLLSGLYLWRRPALPDQAVLWASAGATAVLANISAHYALEPTSQTAVNFVIFMVAAGALLLEPWALGLALAGAMTTWAALSALLAPAELLSTALLQNSIAVVLAIVLRLVHGRTVRELVAAEARLREAEKLEAVGRLAGGIAHDFNNLMTIVRLNVRRAERQAILRGDHESGADLRDSLVATDRAAALTAELLSFARRGDGAPEIVDLHARLAQLTPAMRSKLGDRCELRVEGSPVSLDVRVDPRLFERVIETLVENAADAMPYGGTLLVRLDAIEVGHEERGPTLPPGRWVRLRVRDTGVGMDEATRARVFEPYFTTKRRRGLGLAVAYGIVKEAGGAMFVDSEPGRGSELTLFLPRLPARQKSAALSPVLASVVRE